MNHSFAVLLRSHRASKSGWMVVEVKVQDDEGGSVNGWEGKRKRRGVEGGRQSTRVVRDNLTRWVAEQSGQFWSCRRGTISGHVGWRGEEEEYNIIYKAICVSPASTIASGSLLV